MDNDFKDAGGCKTPASDDGWQDTKDVLPSSKPCDACGNIFVPKWHTARRCAFCRKMKMPYKDDPDQTKPF